VFAGAPPAGVSGEWDRVTGARDSAARVGERVAEDRRALGVVGVVPRNLGFLDRQYRSQALPVAELQAALREAMSSADVVWAPAGLGGHEDHVAVRECALELAGERAIRLYADMPYAVRLGWPHWVTGGRPQDTLRPEARWEEYLGEVSARHALRPSVRELPEEELALKMRVMREYRTQFAALDAVGKLSRPEVSRYEVWWEVSPDGPGRRGATPRG